MTTETFSAYHGVVATALAREMNSYFDHAEAMRCYFDKRDVRGNPLFLTNPQSAETEERRLKIIVFCAIYIEALANYTSP